MLLHLLSGRKASVSIQLECFKTQPSTLFNLQLKVAVVVTVIEAVQAAISILKCIFA